MPYMTLKQLLFKHNPDLMRMMKGVTPIHWFCAHNLLRFRGRGGFQDTGVLSVTDIMSIPPI